MEVLVAVVLATSILPISFADPNGADNIYQGSSERMQPKAGASVPAQAGNVTELTINATSVTKAWQGYYGNVSGRLVFG